MLTVCVMQKALAGFGHRFMAHVRWCEHGAPLWSCGDCRGLEDEGCGIPDFIAVIGAKGGNRFSSDRVVTQPAAGS